MNKKIIIALVISLIVVSGIVLTKGQKKGSEDSISNDGNKNVFTSIKDAMSRDISLVCEFNDEGNSTKSYVKNGAVRISTDNESSQGGEIIIKDKRMYMWDIKTKEGFVYDVPDAEDDNNSGDNQELSQSESYLSMIDKYKDSCKVVSVEDSYFVTPNDVNFQDMNKFLEDLQNQMPQIELPEQ
jgi:hypothetical protein